MAHTIAPASDSKAKLSRECMVAPCVEIESAGPDLMPLVYAMLHLFLRLVKLARLLLRFHLADDFLKNFRDGEAALAFETLDVQLHFAGLADGNFKFALSHNFKQVSGCGTGWIPPGNCSIVPMTDFQPDRTVFCHLVFHHVEPAGRHFRGQLLINVLLHDGMA